MKATASGIPVAFRDGGETLQVGPYQYPVAEVSIRRHGRLEVSLATVGVQVSCGVFRKGPRVVTKV